MNGILLWFYRCAIGVVCSLSRESVGCEKKLILNLELLASSNEASLDVLVATESRTGILAQIFPDQIAVNSSFGGIILDDGVK